MASPARTLKLLIVEDSPDDAGLIIHFLKKNNFNPDFLIVETANDFINALKEKKWELILSDYSLPQFSGLEAFRIFRESNLDIPFILVSGAIGEEAAVEAMKEGIQDYIMKNNLNRLIPAIERELKESLIRQEKIAAEEILQSERKKSELNLSESEARFRLIASLASDAIWEWYVDIDSILWNEGLFSLFGYKSDEIDNRMSWVRKKIHFSDREKFNESLEIAFREKSDYLTLEFKFECADETFKVVNSKVNIFYHSDGRPSRLLGAMIDLTQRKQIEELRIQSLVEGADNERERIARELHDNLSQNLTLASILLQSIRENKGNIQDKVLQAERIVTQVLNDTRDISHNLMPKTLGDFGLAAAVENLVEHVGKGLNMQIRTYFNFGERRFPKPVEVNMFRIIQESVNNSIKHSGATEIHISISRADRELTLMIEDNGKGFSLDESRLSKGIGLKNIENRVIYMNGKLTMESQPGRGTLVLVQIPI
jgi:two-component system sensor histidine kinase UhpB